MTTAAKGSESVESSSDGEKQQLDEFLASLGEVERAEFEFDRDFRRLGRLKRAANDFRRLEARFQEACRRTRDLGVLRRELKLVLPAQAGRLLLNVHRDGGLLRFLYMAHYWLGLCLAVEEGQEPRDYDYLWIAFVRWQVICPEEGRFHSDWGEVFYPFVDRLLGLQKPKAEASVALSRIRAGDPQEISLNRLHAQADIHATACAVVAETLDFECKGLENQIAERKKLLEKVKGEGNETGAVEAVGAKKKPKRRRTRRNVTDKPITDRQREVVEMVGKCGGNKAEAARQMGLDRKTVQQHYDAGMAKLHKAGVKQPSKGAPEPSTQKLPTDHRGQEDIADDEDNRL